MRNLAILLSPESAARVRALAAFPEVRADHVTLAARVPDGEFDPDWIPGRADVGARVLLHAVGLCRDDRIQALRVEIAGSSRRTWDGGTLHVTVSKLAGVESVESNALLARSAEAPLALDLDGVVEWVDYEEGPETGLPA
ncbi:MAG: hypothetical protein HYZ53_09895 [Planctomycetes bacterium]|nr:hypothetical protein [Planctomycetota bacterium]